jgi:prolyl-tRNA synthetase
MKLRNLVGDRFKQRPSDCVVDSHALMVRGGYIKYMANGIYSSYTPLRNITKKLEQIIREEMDKIDGQEVLFPVVLPGTLWEESGRYTSVGNELLRFKDRNQSQMLLGMTHEEAAVHLIREYAQSYTKYPFMIYQIQTKFRDEPRPRAGLIRVREFTMKDAYSFHTSREDLSQYYERCFHAYEKIFTRVGLPQVISVESDSGMMGGDISHEFMLITPVGEDSIAVCDSCGYKANMEVAENIVHNDNQLKEAPIERIYTGEESTIDEVVRLLGIPAENTCKAVVYQKNSTDEYVIVFLRGDLEVNETKLTNLIGEEIHSAVITEESGLKAGYIGPYQMQVEHTLLFDRSLQGINNLICGANEVGYHIAGFSMERDYPQVEYHDLAKIKEGGICPVCGEKTIKVVRGIEVGNIFQLGTKYTETMNLQYVDAEGELHYPLMCSYGIGIGRLAASICEIHHDEYGPIWPMAVAPWQVHLCCLRSDDADTKICADKLYCDLQSAGIEVIYDDREVRAGVMFSDADLLGVPIRVIVSPKNLQEDCIEITTRDKSVNKKVDRKHVLAEIVDLRLQLLKKFE